MADLGVPYVGNAGCPSPQFFAVHAKGSLRLALVQVALSPPREILFGFLPEAETAISFHGQ